MEQKACVFDIQRFSVHDGPGIRTIVFLKGCPLRCLWCCNPESQSQPSVLLYNPELCIGCKNCIAVCKTGANTEENGIMRFDRDKCMGCGACAEVCYAEARTIKGKMMSIGQVFSEVEKDISFYARSGGGLTLSGGEPLLQADFAQALFGKCREAGIGTAVETCGHVLFENFEKILGLTDLFLFDVKHLDREKHKEFTGCDNTLILNNLKALSEKTKNIIIRVPVIPTFNMDEESLSGIIALAAELGIAEVNFLPFHRYAANKYNMLGRSYWNPGTDKADARLVQELAEKVKTGNVKISIGG